MAGETVRGAKISVVATIKHLGIKFRLSRPVDINGQRRRKGWMLSTEGTIMALLSDCPEASALAEFKRLIERTTDRDEMILAVTLTKALVITGNELPWRAAP